MRLTSVNLECVPELHTFAPDSVVRRIAKISGNYVARGQVRSNGTSFAIEGAYTKISDASRVNNEDINVQIGLTFYQLF